MSDSMTTTTIVTTSNAPNNTLKNRFSTIMLVVLGSLTLMFYLAMFRWNKAVFVAFVCVYIITYTLYVIIYTNNKKACFNDEVEYNVLSYISIYTLFFATIMLVLSIFLIRWASAQNPSTSAFAKY